MAKELLSVRTVEAAIAKAASTATRIELSDGGGLVLRCPPSGTARWTYAYRSKATGGMRRVTLGTYGDAPPALSLRAARDARKVEEARNLKGEDPHVAQARERAEHSQAAMTFSTVCERYVEYAKANGKLSWKTDEGYLKRPKAKFGKHTMASITKREILDFLQTIAQTSKSSANRTQSTMRTVWGWATERDLITANILAGLKKVGGKEIEKDRVLTAEELKTFLALLAAPDAVAVPAIRQALQVVLLTAQRPGEVAGMMLSELYDLDGERPHWIIPRLRTKNKKTEHTVPLSPAAVRLIGEALAISKKQADEDGKPKANDQAVFASRYGDIASLSRNSLSQALLAIVRKNGLAKFTPHDLRRTGATLAQSGRIPTDFVKALLNHNDKGVTGIYARWHMFDEKLEAVMAIEAAASLERRRLHI